MKLAFLHRELYKLLLKIWVFLQAGSYCIKNEVMLSINNEILYIRSQILESTSATNCSCLFTSVQQFDAFQCKLMMHAACKITVRLYRSSYHLMMWTKVLIEWLLQSNRISKDFRHIPSLSGNQAKKTLPQVWNMLVKAAFTRDQCCFGSICIGSTLARVCLNRVLR